MSVAGLILATSLAQAAPAAPAAAPVHVHFHTPGNKVDARLFVRRGPESWAPLCAAPCDVDLPPGSQLRAVLREHDDEPHDFVLSSESGQDVDIEARRGGVGALVGGIVMTSLGGITFLIGALVTAISTADFVRDETSVRMGGLITMAIGGGATIGGILMISNRTYEPRIRQRPKEPSRVPDGARPPAATQLSLTFTF